MKTVELAARTRELKGKGPARRCRADGRIPGVLYGISIEPQPLTVSTHEFVNAARGENTVRMMVNLKFDGNGRSEMALVRDVQKDPVTGRIVHIDFLHVSPDRKLKLTVPLKLIGIPEGVKTRGGVLQWIMRELEVECLPGNIPEIVELNVEALGIGDTIHVREIPIEGVTILSDLRRTVVSVVPPTVIKETVTTTDAAAEAAGEAEKVGEGEEGAESAEGKEGKEKAKADATAKKEEKKDRKKE
jgi:large subunit ribosomal protein L25